MRSSNQRRIASFSLRVFVSSWLSLTLSLWFVSSWLQAAPARRVTFRAQDGMMLNGAYYEPSRRPAPGIVLLHMLRRSPADWDVAASQLSDAGFAVLALDYRSADDLGTFAVDVRAAKTFLRERPEVLPNSIGIAGASIGANLAVLDAADDPGVLSIALLSPGLDYKGLRTEAAMKKFGARPALLAGSTKDPYAARSIRHLTTIGPGLREVRLTDAVAHGTVLLARDPDLIPALVDWFKRTLL
jgi:acetyl esterase/lipase